MQRLYLKEWDAAIRWNAIGNSGDPIVYLPGLSMSSVSSFLPVASHKLMTDTTGIMLDYIGSGFSDLSDIFPYTLEAHADTIALVIENLGYSACHFVGHSFGGAVAVQLAIQRPELVKSLLIAEGNLMTGGGPWVQSIAANSKEDFQNKAFPEWLSNLRKEANTLEDGPDILYSSWSQSDVGGIYGNAVALVHLSETFEQNFLNLSIPRCFMFGEENFPNEDSTGSASLPNPKRLESFGVEVKSLPNSGHEMMIGNPEDFTQLLSSFLKNN